MKLKAGKYKIDVNIIKDGERLWLQFPYNKVLLEEVKNMQGAKWHGFEDPPKKMWSISDSARNKFQLDYMAGLNPYAKFEQPLISFKPKYPLRDHQYVMCQHALTRQSCVLAAEMGTGKTLFGLEIINQRPGVWWWVSSKSGCKSVELEFKKWGCKERPLLITYDRLRIMAESYRGPAPFGVIFDESSKIKSPTVGRSRAAMWLADNVRKEHPEGFVILMSGSPAPKDPSDWWHQCEVACPGFLREGDAVKFKRRLCIIEQRETLTGQIYPHLVTWKDSTLKCDKCGLYEVEHMEDDHAFIPSVDEVGLVFERMKGLVLVTLKKDCLQLPDKIYREVECDVDKSTLRIAKTLVDTAPSAAQALTLLRELSDGFQYVDVEDGVIDCPSCGGSKIVNLWHDKDGVVQEPNFIPKDFSNYEQREADCPYCGGVGTVPKFRRDVQKIPCPKHEMLLELLDEHEDRCVIYAGFHGSIDIITNLVEKNGWKVLRCDGRGYYKSEGLPEIDDCLRAMDRNVKSDIRKLCVVGHPGSFGMGLTFTASPSIIYYSNSFNADDRIQSEDRIHRLGMDENRSPTIIDLFHLPSDKYVLDNIKLKRNLQHRTLGEIKELFSE